MSLLKTNLVIPQSYFAFIVELVVKIALCGGILGNECAFISQEDLTMPGIGCFVFLLFFLIEFTTVICAERK